VNGSIITRMVIDMNERRLTSLAQLEAFLDGTAGVEFKPLGDDEARYEQIQSVVRRFRYPRLKRREKGLVIRYLQHTTGYSRQQLTRLIKRACERAPLRKRYRAPPHAFSRRYTDADIALLAEVDAAHGTLSGPATRHLLRRAYEVYGDSRYERLARISNGHLYNLRQHRRYQRGRRKFTRTQARQINIGQRRPPTPNGRPGFIRIDTVHQGDQDGFKGVYVINSVDCVTQWELVAATEKINENSLIPVIEVLLAGYPFEILGFHADNGAEFINRRVAKLLEKLRVELTKSRPRHCNDNALVESKNASVVRKQLGYVHIPQRFAPQVNAFCADALNPYLNFHRPCLFPESYVDAKGKTRKRYPYDLVQTPYEKLCGIPDVEQYLKPDVSLDALHDQAMALTDQQAAERLKHARKRLFQFIDRSIAA